MKMGDIATKLGEVRLDDMKGFGGMFIDKESLWKLLFSFSVNADGKNRAPEWVEGLFKKLLIPEGFAKFDSKGRPITTPYTHASGVPFGYIMNEATGLLEKI